VTDGDTYAIERSIGGEVTTRLHGVDAPKSAQPYGKTATRAACRPVGEKGVRVPIVARKSADTGAVGIEVGGEDLGVLLIHSSSAQGCS